MNFKTLTFTIGAGIAAFLFVGVAVTEFMQQWIEFSLFLGIPAGLVAGAFTAGAVYLGLSSEAPPQRRRVAGAFGAFGSGFLVALLSLAFIGQMGMAIAITVSVVLALLFALFVYLRAGNTADAPREPPRHESV